MRLIRTTIAAISLLVASTSIAQADTPVRDGFTLELGIGAAYSHASFDGASSLNELGNSTLTFSLGMFVTNKLAIMAHMAGAAAYPTFIDGDRVLLTNQFVGLVGQYWITDRFYVSAGAGAALWGVAWADDFEDVTDFGFALSGRAGYSFANWENHSLRIAIEVIPEFFDSRNVVATAINFEWQYF